MILLVFLYFVNSCPFSKHEQYTEDSLGVVASMDETPSKRLQFAGALLMYDPRMMKYQDPRKYDFHTCGTASQKWKGDFRSFLNKVGDDIVDRVLNYDRMIVLFDDANLVGNIIFIPIEGELPQEIIDPIMYRKYIKWAPPANAISAVIPRGYKLKIEFAVEGMQDKVETTYLRDGITKIQVISQPIKALYVMQA